MAAPNIDPSIVRTIRSPSAAAATSITAALHFAEEILAGKPGARDNYLKLLAGGGAVPPYQALKNAGLDMAAPAPYQAVIRRMDRIMDEMEALLAAR